MENGIWKISDFYGYRCYCCCRIFWWLHLIRQAADQCIILFRVFAEPYSLLTCPLECVCCIIIFRNCSAIAKVVIIPLCLGESSFFSAGVLLRWECFLIHSSADIPKMVLLLVVPIFSAGFTFDSQWSQLAWSICFSDLFKNFAEKRVKGETCKRFKVLQQHIAYCDCFGSYSWCSGTLLLGMAAGE